MRNDFSAALAAAERDMGGRGIGTLGEKTLHLALKYYVAPDPETHERPLGRFIADAVTEDGVFEIQTRGLARLKPKLDEFLPLCPVTVVFPVITQKQLYRVDESGTVISERKSPKHESVYTAMREIYALRDYQARPGFRVLLCLIACRIFGRARQLPAREARPGTACTAGCHDTGIRSRLCSVSAGRASGADYVTGACKGGSYNRALRETVSDSARKNGRSCRKRPGLQI